MGILVGGLVRDLVRYLVGGLVGGFVGGFASGFDFEEDFDVGGLRGDLESVLVVGLLTNLGVIVFGRVSVRLVNGIQLKVKSCLLLPFYFFKKVLGTRYKLCCSKLTLFL